MQRSCPAELATRHILTYHQNNKDFSKNIENVEHPHSREGIFKLNTYLWREAPPEKLYKVFNSEEYAQNFLRGELWFKSLESLQKMEGVGNDPIEGKPSVPVKGNLVLPSRTLMLPTENARLGFEGTNLDKIFSCSFSMFGTRPTSSKFGKFLIEMNNTKAIIEEWQDILKHLEYGKIRYFHRFDEINNSVYPLWLLKNKKFIDEEEYRLSFYFANLKNVIQPASNAKDLSGSNDGLTYGFSSIEKYAKLIKIEANNYERPNNKND